MLTTCPRFLVDYFLFLERDTTLCVQCFLGSLTLVLRNFAKNLEGWLDMAMANVAAEMVQAKVTTVSCNVSFYECFRGLHQAFCFIIVSII